MEKLVSMAKWLRLSAAMMLLYCFALAPIAGLSGSVLFGMYSPLGFALLFGSNAAVRYLRSFGQIMASVKKRANARAYYRILTPVPSAPVEYAPASLPHRHPIAP